MQPPADAQVLIEQGRQLHRQGRLAEAEALYRQAHAVDPDNADAMHLLGVLANQRGEHARAAELIGEALRRNPAGAHYHSNLGIALMGLGDWEGAQAQFEAELERDPMHPAALVNLGALLQRQGKIPQAVACYRQALAIRPDDVVLLNNLGFALVQLREFEEARDLACQSLRIDPHSADAYNLLGLIERHRDRPREALELYAQALRLRPDRAEIHQNVGVAYRELGQWDEALAAYERAIRLRPDYPDPHFSRALVLLGQGDFGQGWPEYEYGLWCNERRACPADYPRWRGEPLAGRRILICAEQGLGDEIMFASILPEVIREAGQCVVECHPKLVSLYRRSFPGASVLPTQPDAAAMARALDALPAAAPIEYQSPVGSLALYRRRSLADFPAHTGYLVADPAKVVHWRERLAALGPGLKVGISWRGGLPQTGASRRSIPLPGGAPPAVPRRGSLRQPTVHGLQGGDRGIAAGPWGQAQPLAGGDRRL